jgi:hypothetical protein
MLAYAMGCVAELTLFVAIPIALSAQMSGHGE